MCMFTQSYFFLSLLWGLSAKKEKMLEKFMTYVWHFFLLPYFIVLLQLNLFYGILVYELAAALEVFFFSDNNR